MQEHHLWNIYFNSTLMLPVDRSFKTLSKKCLCHGKAQYDHFWASHRDKNCNRNRSKAESEGFDLGQVNPDIDFNSSVLSASSIWIIWFYVFAYGWYYFWVDIMGPELQVNKNSEKDITFEVDGHHWIEIKKKPLLKSFPLTQLMA